MKVAHGGNRFCARCTSKVFVWVRVMNQSTSQAFESSGHDTIVKWSKHCVQYSVMYDTSAKLQKTANTRLAFCTCQNMVLLKSITGGCRSGEYYQRLRPLCYKKCGNLHVSFKDVMRLRIIRAAQQHRKNRLKRWIGLGMKALEYHHVETTWIKVNKLEKTRHGFAVFAT